MNVKIHSDFKPCVDGAFSGGLTRTSFFDGMVLSEADMLREQGYWSMKRKLTNRALGRGVVWGLNLTWNEKTRCFELCPGYGLSCCGDDLVVECPQSVCEGDLIDPCSEEFRALLADKLDPCDCEPDGPVEACLLLEYVECPEDPRSVFEDPCAESPGGCRYGAVRETTRLRLVPPPCPEPPGPIDRFCEKIEQIRKGLAEAGVELPDTYLGATKPRMTISVADAPGAKPASSGKASLELSETATATARTVVADDATVEFSLVPPPGYVVAEARVDGGDSSDAAHLMGVSFVRPASSLSAGAAVSGELVLLSIMGGEAIDVSLDLAVRREGADAVLVANVANAARRETEENCTSLLKNGLIFKGDPKCAQRTLLLAVLSGWFIGQLGKPPCAGEGEAQPLPAQVLLVWVITWLAWRMLFGVDLREDQARGVMNCLHKLFADWCAGMHYKGPQCHDNKHGVYLGCVQVSPKGRILCFDEWKHRRYVLTGPLINHWSGQFGIAPIDVMATRIASWICCVSKTDLPNAGRDFLGAAGELFQFGNGAIGGLESAGAASEVGGVQVAESVEVGPAEFLSSALRQFQSFNGPQINGAEALRVVSSPALGLQLAMPTKAHALRRENAVNVAERTVTLAIESTPPMARAPMADMVNSFAGTAMLADLETNDRALFAPMVEALEKAEVVSLADLVALGPEPAIARAATHLDSDDLFAEPAAREKAMSLVYNAALKSISTVADVVREEAAAREDEEPFLRADLGDNATVRRLRDALKPTLRGNGMRLVDIRKIAADAIERTP